MKSFLILCAFISTSVYAHEKENVDFVRSMELETTFQKVMSDPNPSVLLQSEQIDRLLIALYRIESYIDDFEHDLDRMVEQANRDPKFTARPLETDSYRRLQVMNRVAEHLESEIVYVYKRMLQVVNSPSASSEDRGKARKSMEGLDRYLGGLALEDQLQFSGLIEKMRDVRDGGDASQNDSLPEFDESDYEQLKANVKFARPATRRKSHEARQLKSSELDLAVQGDQADQERGGRPFTPIQPGVLAGGNVDGTEFDNGVWALTFDDGPHPKYSSPLMDALMNHKDKINSSGAPASFFWLAMNVKNNMTIVKKAVDNHFSTNCHSWTHANLAKQNHDVRVHEVIDAVNLERQAFGRDFRFFRCPYGSCVAPEVPEVRQMIASLGLVHAYWSVDSLDWKLKNAKRTLRIVTKQMKIQKHGIILMHDIHPYSLEAAKMVLAWIADQNNSGQDHITLYTVDSAVDLYNRAGSPDTSTAAQPSQL